MEPNPVLQLEQLSILHQTWQAEAINVIVAKSLVDDSPVVLNLAGTIGYAKKRRSKADDTRFYLRKAYCSNNPEARRELSTLFTNACAQSGIQVCMKGWEKERQLIKFMCFRGRKYQQKKSDKEKKTDAASRKTHNCKPTRPKDDNCTCKFGFQVHWDGKSSRWYLKKFGGGCNTHTGHYRKDPETVHQQLHDIEEDELELAKDVSIDRSYEAIAQLEGIKDRKRATEVAGIVDQAPTKKSVFVQELVERSSDKLCEQHRLSKTRNYQKIYDQENDCFFIRDDDSERQLQGETPQDPLYWRHVIPKFSRTRKISVKTIGQKVVLDCSCGYFRCWGIACRHFFALTGAEPSACHAEIIHHKSYLCWYGEDPTMTEEFNKLRENHLPGIPFDGPLPRNACDKPMQFFLSCFGKVVAPKPNASAQPTLVSGVTQEVNLSQAAVGGEDGEVDDSVPTFDSDDKENETGNNDLPVGTNLYSSFLPLYQDIIRTTATGIAFADVRASLLALLARNYKRMRSESQPNGTLSIAGTDRARAAKRLKPAASPNKKKRK